MFCDKQCRVLNSSHRDVGEKKNPTTFFLGIQTLLSAFSGAQFHRKISAAPKEANGIGLSVYINTYADGAKKNNWASLVRPRMTDGE